MPSVAVARRRAVLALVVSTLAAPVLIQAQAVPASALVQDFRWRNIGPANMAGGG